MGKSMVSGSDFPWSQPIEHETRGKPEGFFMVIYKQKTMGIHGVFSWKLMVIYHLVKVYIAKWMENHNPEVTQINCHAWQSSNSLLLNMAQSKSCCYSNAINHPPFITIFVGSINRQFDGWCQWHCDIPTWASFPINQLVICLRKSPAWWMRFWRLILPENYNLLVPRDDSYVAFKITVNNYHALRCTSFQNRKQQLYHPWSLDIAIGLSINNIYIYI